MDGKAESHSIDIVPRNKRKMSPGQFECYSCPLMLCKSIATGTKCKVNAVHMMVITPLPHTFRPTSGVLCTTHLWSEVSMLCLEQCRMLHMQCMWGVIHEIGCSFARYRYETCVKPGVCTHLGGLTPYQTEPDTCYCCLAAYGCITQMPYITACCHESRMSHREPHTPHLITMAY